MIFNAFVLALCINSLTTLETLCASGKNGNKCTCSRITDQDTGWPSSKADCAGLAINSFPDIHQFPDDVTDLDLSANNIDILDSSIVNVSSATLKTLIVSFNVISYVDAKFFEGLPELHQLDLSHNNISSLENGDIFLKQEKLRFLYLGFNYIKQLPQNIFKPLTSLQFLDLSYNPLGDFLMGSKDVLNGTLGIELNIEHLVLDNVGLNDLYSDFFDLYKKLTQVRLADNNFTFIPTLPYSVEYLDLSGNNLSFVSAKYLNYHSLKFLQLSRMPSLTSIHHYAFYNLQSLEMLVITDCPNVSNFTELAFGLASKTTDIHPTILILARNGIRSLNSTYRHLFRSMKHIDLRHNPWDCDCDILWLQEFDTELFKGHEIRCASPRNLRNKSIMDLIHLDLQQCYPDIYGKTSHRVLIVILMTTVVFLIGFIFYLMRYPKSWINPKNIGLGPTSPYSIADQDEIR